MDWHGIKNQKSKSIDSLIDSVFLRGKKILIDKLTFKYEENTIAACLSFVPVFL